MRSATDRLSHVLVLSIAVGLPGAAAAAGMVLLPKDEAPDVTMLTLPELVSELGSEFFPRREAAQKRLLLNQDLFEESELIEQLGRDDLDPEQRLRVEQALRSQFMTTSRAGMGVGFARTLDQTQRLVVIERLIGGFPAKEQGLLRPGDVFVEVGGDVITGQSARIASHNVVIRIISYNPGEVIPLRIFRPEDPDAVLSQSLITLNGVAGEYLDVLVPVGRYEDLQNQSNRPPETLTAGWRVRMERLGAALWGPSAIRISVGDEDWDDLADPMGSRRAPYLMASRGLKVGLSGTSGIKRTNIDGQRALTIRARQDEEREQIEQFRKVLSGEDGGELLELVQGDQKKHTEVLTVITQLVEFQKIREEHEEQLAAGPADLRQRELIVSELANTNRKMAELRQQLIGLVGDAPLFELRKE